MQRHPHYNLDIQHGCPQPFIIIIIFPLTLSASSYFLLPTDILLQTSLRPFTCQQHHHIRLSAASSYSASAIILLTITVHLTANLFLHHHDVQHHVHQQDIKYPVPPIYPDNDNLLHLSFDAYVTPISWWRLSWWRWRHMQLLQYPAAPISWWQLS